MFTFLMPARRRMVFTPEPVRSWGITQAAAREAVVRRRSCTRVKYMCVILFVGIQVASCSTQPRETRQENSTAMFHRLSWGISLCIFRAGLYAGSIFPADRCYGALLEMAV